MFRKLHDLGIINKHSIKLELDKQSPKSPIYNLKPVKLENLKTYIKTNLANSFICLFKFLTKILITFDQKLDGNIDLYVNY